MPEVKRRRNTRPGRVAAVDPVAHLDRRISAIFVVSDLAASLIAFLHSQHIEAGGDELGHGLGTIVDLSHDTDLDRVAELLEEWAARRQWW